MFTSGFRSRLLALALLLGAGIPAQVQQPEKTESAAACKVLDGAALFGGQARQKADADIAEIKRLFARDLLIETVPLLKLPANLKDPKDTAGRIAFFRKWSVERYLSHRIEGVHVLIVREPKAVEVLVGTQTRNLGFFSPEQANELLKVLRQKSKEGFDKDAVVDIAAFVRKAMEHNVARKKIRETLVQETNALFKQGKIKDAIAIAEKILAIDRQVYGPEHNNVVTTLTEISVVHERIEDFAAAQKTRAELARIQAKRFGETSWQAIDARLQLELVEKLAGLDAKGRADYKESSRFLTEAIACNKPDKHRQGAELAEKAVEINARILGKDHERTAVASAWAGFFWTQIGEVKKARGHYEHALAVRKRVLGDGHPDTARSLINLGSLLQEEKKYLEARSLYEQALAIRMKTLGETHVDTIAAMDVVGYVLQIQKEYAAARVQYEQALAARKKILGMNHAETAMSLARLGELLNLQGDYAGSRAFHEQALAIRKKVLGEDHADTAWSLTHLGVLLERQKEYAAARACYEQALAIRKKVLGENHADTAVSFHNLGVARERDKDYAGARSLYEQALAIRKKVLGDSHPDTAVSLEAVGLVMQAQRDYPGARRYYEQALALRKKVLGENHLDTANCLNNLAIVLEKQDDHAAARRCHEQALAIRKKILGEKHVDTAKSITRLGSVLDSLEDHAAARAHLQQALEIQKNLPGDNQADIAYTLSLLGRVLDHEENYASARAHLEQALAIREKSSPEDLESIAFALAALGDVLQKQKDHAAARAQYERALAIRKKVLGDHRDTAWSLAALGISLEKSREYAAARTHYEQALAMRKKVLGDNHRDVADSLTNLGIWMSRENDFASARRYHEDALAIRKKACGDQHKDTAESLGYLGGAIQNQGDYAAARSYLEQALATNIKVLKENDRKLAWSLNNIGALLRSQGDYAVARPYYERALAIQKKARRDYDADTVAFLNNLGLVLVALEDYAAARPYIEQALAISKKISGEEDDDTARTIHNLGLVHNGLGEPETARLHYERALKIKKKVLGDDHPEIVSSLNNIANLLLDNGDFVAARRHYEQGLAIHKKAFGEHHPGNIPFLNNLGAMLSKQGDDDAARKHFEQALALARRTLELAAAVQSEREQLLMGGSLDYPLNGLLRLKGPAAKLAADYDHVLAWKGAVFARQQRLRLERAIDPSLASLVEELRTTTGKLATLSFAAPDPKDRDTWNKQLEDLSGRKEKLERELAQKSPLFKKDREQQKLSAAQLMKLLPADAILVDLLVYSRYEPDKAKKGNEVKHDQVAAFVLKPGSDVVRVDLGPLAPIEKAIDEWRAATRKPAGKNHPGFELRRLLWEPLEKHVAGARTVLLSPDGALGRLPFAALPGSKAGAYLLEEINLAVVPLPRLLTELLDRARQAEREPTLLLVGDVDFNAGTGKSAASVAKNAATRSGERMNWEPLEGTRGEILAIRDSFAQRFNKGKVTVLRGEDASEAALRQLGSKYSILHLATHGFFADPKVRSALARADKQQKDTVDAFGDKGVTGFHPGLLSGLVLAGANQPPQLDRDDGILTALEVAELDLRTVELAALSACETGLGKVAAGEGILGLQRAFQIAGARTVVSSLWSVPDEPTQVLMTRFYRNLWEKKLSRLEALREAQIWMLREGRADLGVQRGLARLKPADRPDPNAPLPPYFWAAFVLSGDWR